MITERWGSDTTVEPLLRGHNDERPPLLERPLDDVNLNINVLISTPDERPPLLKCHFSDAKGMASQEGFHCICKVKLWQAGCVVFQMGLVQGSEFISRLITLSLPISRPLILAHKLLRTVDDMSTVPCLQ